MKKLYTLFLTVLAINFCTAQITLTEAVDFTVTDLHGEEHNLFEQLDAGKYVMIDLFAYWCGPCCTTAPKIKLTFEEYGCNTGDLFVIGMEGDGTTAQTEEFENTCGSAGAHPVISGLDGGGSEVVDAYSPAAFPTIILIAPDRTIVEQDIWPYENATVDAMLATYGIEKQECAIVSGVEDFAQINAVDLTPNPVEDIANLNFNLAESAKISVEVYNITGQQVYQNIVGQKTAGNHQLELPTTNLAIGTYLVKISVDGALVETIKMNKI